MSSKFDSRIKDYLKKHKPKIKYNVITDKQRAKINPVNKAVASKIPSNKRK